MGIGATLAAINVMYAVVTVASAKLQPCWQSVSGAAPSSCLYIESMMLALPSLVRNC
jgi:hypothetical protein